MSSRSKVLLDLALKGKRASYFGGENVARRPRLDVTDEPSSIQPPNQNPIKPYNLSELEERELTGSVRSIDLER